MKSGRQMSIKNENFIGREKDDSTPLRPSLVGSELVQIKLFGSKGLGLLVEQVKDIFLKKVHQKADVKSSNKTEVPNEAPFSGYLSKQVFGSNAK